MKRSRSWVNVVGTVSLVLFTLNGNTVRATSDYVVRADDKLKIKIFQYPELSGEYKVRANGTISIAPIGDIPVNGLSTKEIAGQIAERFVRSGISDKPGASVEVLETRPVYVLGDVQKPGEYQFRPGMTVLQVVSLAGGWLRFSDPGLMRLDRDSINITGDMRNLVRRYYELTARRARLNSELVMRSDIQFPPELLARSQSDGGVRQLIDEERSLLNIHVDSLKTQIDSLEQNRALYEREIEAIKRQIEANKVQVASVEKELKEVRDLVKRGLTTISRLANLERMQAQLEMNEQGFQTLILRSRQNITQADQRIFDLKSERNASLTAEVQKVRMDLDEVSVKFDTNRSLLVEAKVTVPTLIGNSDGPVETRSLTVVRIQDGKSETIDAPESMELLPGDVLRVQRSIIPGGGLGIAGPLEQTNMMMPAKVKQ
ncbi:protein involved in polysaccharide export with SLBB domain [Bosea sp. OAE752]|jgi:protein involved in polysaccharide export with SLBB domain|uniref:polysaccharide biosynthesis/export family protein n=1 Tax=unclassified Bosea (in: a-proteobacteria) TaxID=2653178 RepID=UPI0005713C79|nr:polysaccharide biosynthesis/export family protein [Bosea sp. UNC402CLCol]